MTVEITIVSPASKLNRASFLFLLVHFHLRIMPGNVPPSFRCPLVSGMATEVSMSNVIIVILKISFVKLTIAGYINHIKYRLDIPTDSVCACARAQESNREIERGG